MPDCLLLYLVQLQPGRQRARFAIPPQVAPYAGGVTDSGSAADLGVAAFFDLDKTVIAKSSTLAFGRPFFQSGLINRRAVLKSAYAQFVFASSGADADQVERIRAHLTSLCTGWDVNQV